MARKRNWRWDVRKEGAWGRLFSSPCKWGYEICPICLQGFPRQYVIPLHKICHFSNTSNKYFLERMHFISPTTRWFPQGETWDPLNLSTELMTGGVHSTRERILAELLTVERRTWEKSRILSPLSISLSGISICTLPLLDQWHSAPFKIVKWKVNVWRLEDSWVQHKRLGTAMQQGFGSALPGETA